MSKFVLIGSEGTIGSYIKENSIHSFFEVDIKNRHAFFELEEIDIVLHFGEKSSPDLTLNESLDNIVGTLEYLKHALKCGCKTFIYASSHRVYGSWEDDLEKPFYPTTNYGIAKGVIEGVLRDFSQEKMSSIILRIGTLLNSDTIGNTELEILNNEWAGKYNFTRSFFSDFVHHLDEFLTEKQDTFKVYNVLPINSNLNHLFDGENFYNRTNI